MRVAAPSGGPIWLPEYTRSIERAIREYVRGTVTLTTRVVTATGSLTIADCLTLVNATGGAVTVTLPAAAISTGRMMIVKKTDASGNAVTIDGSGAETIDGAATKSLPTQYSALTMVCDGTGWHII